MKYSEAPSLLFGAPNRSDEALHPKEKGPALRRPFLFQASFAAFTSERDIRLTTTKLTKAIARL